MTTGPDSSAIRTALWRALHVEIDAPPHLIEDTIGAALAAPGPDWRDRPDMHPIGTAPYRIGIVARTRFVEDLATGGHIRQYVLPFDLVAEPERAGLEGAARGAAASGTPWISFFSPDEIVDLALQAGFRSARQVSTATITARYRPVQPGQPAPAAGEGLLLAET